MQHADDAGATEPGADLELGGVQALGDDLGGPALLEGQLGMAVEVAAQGDEALTPPVDLLRPFACDRLHMTTIVCTPGVAKWNARASRVAAN